MAFPRNNLGHSVGGRTEDGDKIIIIIFILWRVKEWFCCGMYLADCDNEDNLRQMGIGRVITISCWPRGGGGGRVYYWRRIASLGTIYILIWIEIIPLLDSGELINLASS